MSYYHPYRRNYYNNNYKRKNNYFKNGFSADKMFILSPDFKTRIEMDNIENEFKKDKESFRYKAYLVFMSCYGVECKLPGFYYEFDIEKEKVTRLVDSEIASNANKIYSIDDVIHKLSTKYYNEKEKKLIEIKRKIKKKKNII